jgi:hypothetical protein
MKRLEVSQKRVLELFKYEDGKLFRRSDNKEMGIYSTKHHRYARIVIDGKDHKLHRIIFLYHHGYLPDIIDHINGDRYDNRIENLREANTYQNRQNSRIYSTSKSGVKNVYWNSSMNKWRVSIHINGKKHCFGHYADLEEAKQVATSMRDKYFKEFANHGSY